MAWVESIQDQPPAVTGGELIIRAHEVLARQPAGPRRYHLERDIEGLFDPQAREAYRIELATRRLVAGATALLREEDRTLEMGGLRDVGHFLALVALDEKYSGEEPEEPDPFQVIAREEREAARREAQALELSERIYQAIGVAELGVQFSAGADRRDPDTQWTIRDTLSSIREITRLQAELGLPIVSDRLRDLIINGLDAPFNGYAANLLIQIAGQTDDYAAFLAARQKYRQAVAAEENIWGCEQAIIGRATRFMEAGEPALSDPRALRFALQAVAHYDPVHTFYPSTLARLGRALQNVVLPTLDN